MAKAPARKGAELARRLTVLHQEDIRKKIQAAQLIKVLQNHALNGDSDISLSRMRAIEILLRKSVADLSAITVSGDPDAPINTSLTVTFK